METKVSLVNLSEIEDFKGKEWAKFFKERNMDPTLPRRYAIAAYVQGKIRGCAVLNSKRGVLELEEIIITKKLRGNGIATQLLDFTENLAREKKLKKVILETSDLHGKAREFYQNRGYKVNATLPHWYYGERWYIMSKKI